MFKLIKGQRCADSKYSPLGAFTWLAAVSPDQRLPEAQGHVTGRECMCTSPRVPSCCESRESVEGGEGTEV